jgi:glycosyltransferase involved in cell wall biosynthesis
MSRSVLYLAYFFPPRGGAAVQRSLKFAKYLPEFGWRPLVVANGGAIEDKTLKVQDPTMLKELPEGAVVRYTALNERENRRYLRAQSKFRQRLNITDPMGWWVEPAIRLGMELATGHKPDAIVVTMSPFTAARAGMELKRRTGLPLIFDLRDPWALDETRIYPTRWHAARDRAAMKRAMIVADRVIMNTPQSAAALREAFDIPTEKVVAITNGYDAADFGHSQTQRAPDDVFRIVHTGMFHTDLAGFWDDLLAKRGVMNKLKFAPRPINLWTRTPRYLLEAIERVISRGDIAADKLELVLVGELSPQDREMVQRSKVASSVKMLGYTPHAQSVGWLESADALFLPLHTPLDHEPTLVVPGKAYEYLGSGRPILAMCPPGDMRDFVTNTRSGIVTGGDDVPAAADALVKLYRAKLEGRILATQDRPAVEQFERRHLTQRLAKVLDAVCERPHL